MHKTKENLFSQRLIHLDNIQAIKHALKKKIEVRSCICTHNHV